MVAVAIVVVYDFFVIIISNSSIMNKWDLLILHRAEIAVINQKQAMQNNCLLSACLVSGEG